MAALFLPDLIHQCRLARWEEEYCIMDTLEIPPAQKICYPLLLCAGQEIKVKICASAPVEASIGFESREPENEPPEPFNFNPEASCFVIDHEAKRTAYYLLAIVNNSAEPIDVTVEIAANLRERTLRPRLESVLRRVTEVLQRRKRFSQVIARSDPGNR
jgi:hypothetical protein